jgi:hypothetical protein
MGLLDDLKKQAEQRKTQQLSEQALREEGLSLVEEKMKQSFQYLHDLLNQLSVLKPVNPMAFAIPGVGEFKDLQFEESFIDYRKTRVLERDVFDQINFYVRWGSPARLVVERDMPAAEQKTREVLFANGIKFTEEEVKNERFVAATWKFSIETGLVTDIRIRADHKQANLLISGKNLMRLGMEDFAVPAGDVNEQWLEDFAVTLLGQPGNLRKYRVVSPVVR